MARCHKQEQKTLHMKMKETGGTCVLYLAAQFWTIYQWMLCLQPWNWSSLVIIALLQPILYCKVLQPDSFCKYTTPANTPLTRTSFTAEIRTVSNRFLYSGVEILFCHACTELFRYCLPWHHWFLSIFRNFEIYTIIAKHATNVVWQPFHLPVCMHTNIMHSKDQNIFKLAKWWQHENAPKCYFVVFMCFAPFSHENAKRCHGTSRPPYKKQPELFRTIMVWYMLQYHHLHFHVFWISLDIFEVICREV